MSDAAFVLTPHAPEDSPEALQLRLEDTLALYPRNILALGCLSTNSNWCHRRQRPPNKQETRTVQEKQPPTPTPATTVAAAAAKMQEHTFGTLADELLLGP